MGIERITVLLADDHVLVREGTRHVLEHEADMEVVGEAGDGEESVRLVEELRPDVAIVDMAMPGVNGIEATRRIKARAPGTAVLVLSAYDDDQYVFAVLEAGAAGYLLKDASSRELVNAIRAIRSGEAVLHPAIARKVLNRFMRQRVEAPPVSGVPEVISSRELEVLTLAGRGWDNTDIGTELGISTRTVQAHLTNIFRKIGVTSRTEAVIVALRRGWLTLEDMSEPLPGD
ncbi:MAG: response regulator transcription factor [Chloroflexi bacterium]|nr:response regulator transcription factor [Chloroflexota bacterium]